MPWSSGSHSLRQESIDLISQGLDFMRAPPCSQSEDEISGLLQLAQDGLLKYIEQEVNADGGDPYEKRDDTNGELYTKIDFIEVYQHDWYSHWEEAGTRKAVRVAAEVSSHMQILVGRRKEPRSEGEASEPMRLLDLPDELVLEVTRCLLASNAVQSVLRLAGTASNASLRLATARGQAERRRLQWVAELSRQSAPPLITLEIRCSCHGRQAIALAWDTAIAGPELPATGCIAWTIKVDRCIDNGIRIGICHAWPSDATQCWGFHHKVGHLHQMVWDESGCLVRGRGNLPLASRSKVRCTMRGELVSIECVLDRDAGTLQMGVAEANGEPEGVGEVRLSRPFLRGIPPGAALRPWVHLSNAGDAVTFEGGFYRVL